MRSKQDRSWSGRVDEENGHGMLGGRGCEDGDISVWMKAADDECTGWPIDAQACGAEGDAAVGIDAGVGALTPDVRPPRAGWSGTQSRAFFAEMHAQLVEQDIGRAGGGDVLGGEDRGQALLPEVVEAFDFGSPAHQPPYSPPPPRPLACGVGA